MATAWNLIGLLDHKGGLGNAARTNVRALQDLVGQCRQISYPSARYKAQDAIQVPAIHGHNYLHFNPCSVGAGILKRCAWFRHGINIGFWAWETTLAPERWLKYDEWMRQIWVPSEFVKDSLEHTGFAAPVFVVPHTICPQPQHDFGHICTTKLCKPQPITFMVQFDGQSRVSRKRPDLSLQAIQQAALRQGERVHIIIKTHRNDDVQFSEYPNITVETIDHWLTDAQMDALWRRVDILVSLNRGEGFGLPMAEAMSRGIPVVATHWGAALEYMGPDNSYPVPPLAIEPCALSGDEYFGSGNWALPDVEAATLQVMAAMRDLRSGYWMAKGAELARYVSEHFSSDRMKAAMLRAISQL